MKWVKAALGIAGPRWSSGAGPGCGSSRSSDLELVVEGFLAETLPLVFKVVMEPLLELLQLLEVALQLQEETRSQMSMFVPGTRYCPLTFRENSTQKLSMRKCSGLNSTTDCPVSHCSCPTAASRSSVLCVHKELQISW